MGSSQTHQLLIQSLKVSTTHYDFNRLINTTLHFIKQQWNLKREDCKTRGMSLPKRCIDIAKRGTEVWLLSSYIHIYSVHVEGLV